jgi:hypothetical protein
LMANEAPSTAARLTTFQQSLFGSLHETISLIAQQDDRQRLQPEDVPAALRRFFISPSGKFLLQVYPKGDVWQRDMQEKFIRELRTVDPLVTGSPVQYYEYTSQLKQSVQNAALYAAGAIALLVFLHFHRVSSVLLALLPVALSARVEDGSGRPLPNVPVTWQPSQSISVSNASSASDASGIVSATVILGSAGGAAHTTRRPTTRSSAGSSSATGARSSRSARNGRTSASTGSPDRCACPTCSSPA